MLSDLTALTYLGVLYLLSLPVGYLVLSNSLGPRLRGLSPAFVVIFSIALGMISMTLILTIIGLMIITGLAILAVSMTSLAIILLTHSYRLFPKKVGVPDAAMVMVFALTMTYVTLVLGYLGWPNPGDAMLHSNFVSLLVNNRKFGLYLSPIAPEFPFNFPPGFHILAADYILLTGGLPAESVFLLGGAITILIQVLIFLAAYIATKSAGLAVLAYSSSFAIHPSLDLERWLLGYFYSGPYPFLFAVSGMTCFLTLLVMREIDRGLETWPHPGLLPTIMTLWMAVTYTPYTAFLLVFLALDVLARARRNPAAYTKKLVSRQWLSYGAVAGGLVLYSNYTLGLRNILGWAITLWTWVVPFPLHVYAITPATMYDSVLGLSGVVAGIASIYFMTLSRHFRGAATLYLIIFIPTVISVIPAIGGILYFLLPLRTTVVIESLSWVIIAVFSGHIIDSIPWSSVLARVRRPRNSLP